MEKNISFKRLELFFLAATGLLATGLLMRSEFEWEILAILVWSIITGVFLVYRLNDCIDQDAELKLNIKKYFSFPIHVIMVVQLFCVLIPASYFYMNRFTFTVLGISALVGSIYSLSFNIGGKQFRIKNIFLLKNLLIGAIWGSLVLIGAGYYNNTGILSIFLFCSVQVVIGSMIRDVPDLEKDKKDGVRSLPVVLGIPGTLFFMRLLNLASIACAYFVNWDEWFLFLFGAIALWRLITLTFLGKDPQSKYWSQTANLLTCVFIPIILFAILKYGISA